VSLSASRLKFNQFTAGQAMGKVYTNDVVEALVWAQISKSESSQDYLDFVHQFTNTNGPHWFEALDQATYFFSPANPEALGKPRLYERAFEHLLAHAESVSDPAAKGTAYFHLGKMLQQGFGIQPDSCKSIEFYRQAMALGEVRAFINCGAHFDGPDASEEDLKIAYDLFYEAAEQGEGMGLIRIAERVTKPDEAARYELYLKAADVGTAFGIYRVATSHLFGRAGQAKNIELGLQWLERAAKNGCADACNLLGWHYHEENFKDPKRSFQWHMMGAKLGHRASMRALSSVHFHEADNGISGMQALHWFLRAAVLGDLTAQYSLGRLNISSNEPEKHPLGLQWLTLAADSGQDYAAWRVSMAYREGVGCEPDPLVAHRYCEQAAHAGFPEAQGQLGLNYWYGVGAQQDYDLAFKWINLCALQGEARGIYLLASLYEMGYGCELNLDEAFRLYKQAHEKGDLDATYELGEFYLFGLSVAKDIAQAAVWYRLGAAKGHAKCMVRLGMLLRDGEGVLENYEEAFEWFSKAAQLDEPRAMYLLALLYAEGDGVAQNEEECRRWMAKAAMQDYEPAKKWIAENLPEPPRWLGKLLSAPR
jgi:uncharacterized protein